MKKFTLITAVAVMLAMAIPCPAQNTTGKRAPVTDYKFYELPGVKNTCEVSVPKGYEKVTKNGVTTFVKKQGINAPRVNEGEAIPVKCVFDCNMADWEPSYIIAYNKNHPIDIENPEEGQMGYYDWENNYATMYLEPGTYDFLAVFQKKDPMSYYWRSYNAFVVKEGVDVSGEITLNFDPNTATNHIAMRSYNPNGDLTRLGRMRYTDMNYNYEILEDSYITDVNLKKQIYHEDFGELYSLYTNLGMFDIEYNPDCPELGQWKGEEWNGDFYVNDCSDKYMFQQFRIMLTDDETYSTVIRAKGGHSQTATNDYTKHSAPFEFNYVNSPANTGRDECEYPYGMLYFSTYNKVEPGFISGLSSMLNGVHKIHYCPPSTVPEYDAMIDFGFQFNFVDCCVNDTIDFGDGEIYIWQNEYSTNSQYIFPQADSNNYVYSANQTCIDSPVPGEPRYALPGAEGLNFDYSSTDLVAGGTCPIAINMYCDSPQWWDDPEPVLMPVFYTFYKGQMGEFRSSDNLVTTLELKADDEVVATTAEEMDNWSYGEHYAPAVLTLSMSNRNFEVDGIEGGNDLMCVVDQAKDDCFAPLLTALQFRQNDGFVTNRFENNADGTMAIMCGDFNEQINENYNFWFNYDDCDVIVEYAPNGTDYFQTIVMTKDDSKFYMPGYGAYYSTDLAAFTEPSVNGWYDLRITLKDEAGNYQVQTFGPAVRIGNGAPTGIDVVKNSDATEVARYTIEGRAISTPQAGVNIVKMSDGTVKKVLVK